jgi:hypothetical protein
MRVLIKLAGKVCLARLLPMSKLLRTWPLFLCILSPLHAPVLFVTQEKVTTFLEEFAGSVDVLDRLEEYLLG